MIDVTPKKQSHRKILTSLYGTISPVQHVLHFTVWLQVTYALAACNECHVM